MKKIWPILILFILILPAVWTLIPSGFYVSHDGEFNLIRLMHFYDELSAGQFPVRWAFDLSYRYGSPVFSFFYPLMYYIGSAFHFVGLDFGTSLKAVILLATFGGAGLMYLWLARRFSTFASLVGTLLYIYVPFRLLTMYVTGSFGVLLSLMFAPLAFLATDGLAQKKNIALIAVAIFGILTSHNVTVLVLLPVVIAYLLAQRKYFLRGILGLALGLGLASFFVFPALLETKYVFLSKGVVVDFRDHFPTLKQLIYSPWGYFYSVAGDADGMSFQIGVAQIATLAFAGGALILTLKKKIKENGKLAALFLAISLVSIFLMLPISKPVWEFLPMLAQIQFPWRILVIFVITTPFLAAFITDTKFGKIVAVGLLLLVVWNNRNYLRTWEMTRYPDDSYPGRESLFYGSTDIAWETRPIWVEKKPVWLAPVLPRNGNKIEVGFEKDKAEEVMIDQFYYPTWQATLDGKKVEIKPTEKTGLISVSVPEGKHTLMLSQEKTTLQKAADLISLVSLVIIFFLIRP